MQTGAMRASVDESPWEHPFLTQENLARFRRYSEGVWQIASRYASGRPERLRCAFAVNLAQNMYNWARLAQKYGAQVALFPDVEHKTALSCPEWEDYQGEFENIQDGAAFLRENHGLTPEVPCYRIPRDGEDLLTAFQKQSGGSSSEFSRLREQAPGLRYDQLLAYPGFYPYYRWAKALSEFDVVYAANMPFAAYASGAPYSVCPTGGEVRVACGKPDVLGHVLRLSFSSARFVTISNPHLLSHCRRLGFGNGVYLPFPVDDQRYCPGEGQARIQWEQAYGKGVFVFTPVRLDEGVKGFGGSLFEALLQVIRVRPEARFVLIAWGDHASRMKDRINNSQFRRHFILLHPVGKKRLIDYYRSCDVVLDQLVWGYYGATALEAAAIGKPIVMKLRNDQYAPLYQGDVAPVAHATDLSDVINHLTHLIGRADERVHVGTDLRQWLVRTHGAERTVPLLLGLLRLTADGVPLPQDLVNPLQDSESEEEKAYHAGCLRDAS